MDLGVTYREELSQLSGEQVLKDQRPESEESPYVRSGGGKSPEWPGKGEESS